MLTRRSLLAGLAATPVAVALAPLAEAVPAAAAEATSPGVSAAVGMVRMFDPEGRQVWEAPILGDLRLPDLPREVVEPFTTYRMHFVGKFELSTIDLALLPRAGPEPG